MTDLKAIHKIKNLLIEAKHNSYGMEFKLTSKLDIALTSFLNEYKEKTKELTGSEILEHIR